MQKETETEYRNQVLLKNIWEGEDTGSLSHENKFPGEHSGTKSGKFVENVLLGLQFQ